MKAVASLHSRSVLFSTIGAVVADTEGVLSHCATVVRENGIPCVVGTIVASVLNYRIWRLNGGGRDR
jgi:phosphohistidine swiveling domain-containing protein